MNKRTFIKLLASWLIAWLPIAGAVASVMPIYSSSSQMKTPSSDAAAAGAETDTLMAAMPCHAVADAADSGAASSSSSACPHCVLCHIAGAVVPQTIPQLATAHQHDCPVSLGVVNFTSYVPPLLQRPPSDPHVV